MNTYWRYTKISDPRSIRYYIEVFKDGILVHESWITRNEYRAARDLASNVTRYGNDESFTVGIEINFIADSEGAV